MATEAKVTSIEALEVFRASIIIFLTKAHQSLDLVTDEIRRMRSWIQEEQRTYWEGEVRRRSKVLAQAEQELLSAKMVKLLDNLQRQQAIVHKARHALEEAEEKLRNVKRWTRDFDSCAGPLAKSLDSLREYLAQDVPKGIAYLTQAITTLEAYSEVLPAEVIKSPPTGLSVSE
jgi:DNA repair exonuclease SbcCD ATPase subunit